MTSNTNNKRVKPDYLIIALVILRLMIGWHLCYEGFSKLMIPGWSAEAYLAGAKGIFAHVFHWMSAEKGVLTIVNILNVWGLILIGIALFIGVFGRMAAFSGALLLLLYYMAYPPFGGGYYGMPTEGSYFVVSKNLIEIAALIVLGIIPTCKQFGLERLILHLRKSKEPKSVTIDNLSLTENPQLKSRRELLKVFGSLPVFGGLAFAGFNNLKDLGVDGTTGATIKVNKLALKDLKGQLPKGKVRNLEFSRLIMGCNLIGGWAHSRDLIYASPLFKAYNTDQKIFETLQLAEQAGINTTFMTYHYYPLFNKYKKEFGSKMQSICQSYPDEKDLFGDINKAIDSGATAIYIQGAIGDRMVREGKIDLIAKVIEHIKKQGYLAGVGSHALEVPIECEKAGINPDFYVKTFHSDQYWSAHPRESRKIYSVDGASSADHNQFHDNMFDLFPDKTAEFMKSVNKPWFAFKVLAAGAIHPKDGFKFAFENGADFICVGMFDFQVVENVNIATEILKNLNRERKWFA